MSNSPTEQEIVDRLNLEPHPEGGYYRETYRSDEKVHRENGSSRHAGTGIYFLLPAEVCTRWHRFGADELWHFYNGDQLVIETVDGEGNFNQLLLNDFSGEGDFQQLVPESCWQRSYSTGSYTLVGTTVFPAFEFDNLEMIEQHELAERYPDIAAQVCRNPFS